MSSFILRRYGRNFKASGLKVLVEWIKEGRVLPTDLIFVEEEDAWRQATEIKAIEPYFPQGKDYPPKKLPPRVFWVKRRGAKVPAEGEKTLLEWAQNGNLGPTDLVFHPALRQWFVAGDSPRLVKHMPAHKKGLEALVPKVEDPFAGPETASPAATNAETIPPDDDSHRGRTTVPELDHVKSKYGDSDTDSEHPKLTVESGGSDSTIASQVADEELEAGFDDTMAGEEVLVTHNELARVTLPGGIGAVLPEKDPSD